MKKLLVSVLAVITLLAGSISSLSSLGASGDRVKAAPVRVQDNRPNIVFILADDLDELTMPYWDAMSKTAELLRDRGVRFTNAFAPTPICCPARSSILTGKYGHNTGVLTNGGEFGGWHVFKENGHEERTMAVYLQQTGYRTALIGKYLNGIEEDPSHIPPGWSEWNAFVDNLSYTGYRYQMNENGTIVSYGSAESDYGTDVVANKARDFIARAEQNDNQPFFLYVAPTAPHLPIPPAPRHSQNPYSSADSPRRPNYNEPDISDKSSWLRISGEKRKEIVDNWNDTDYRNRMGSLYALDDLIESVIRTLEANGELDNTLIVFTSDNGYNLGAHRLIHKMVPYEESLRVPLVIAGPGISPRIEDRMALEIDFAPTFLEMAGLPVPADMDGHSLRPLLDNTPPANWRTDFIAQYRGGAAANGVGAELPPGFSYLVLAQDIPSYQALRNQNYTFIEWYADDEHGGLHEYELYDLNQDPFQLYNLLSTPAGRIQYRDLVEQLKARLAQLEECVGASCQ